MPGTCCQHCDNSKADHDILVRLDENMKNVLVKFKEQEVKLVDHEKRIRAGEKVLFKILGASIAIAFLLRVAEVIITTRH